MAECDRAAIRVHMRAILGNAEFAQNGDALAGEGFVQLDDVEIGGLETKALAKLARCRDRPEAHDARGNAAGRSAEDARDRRQPVFRRRLLGGDDQRRRTIVHARGVAGGDGAAFLAERCAELGELLQRGVAARMLVDLDADGIALALRDQDRNDFLAEPAVLLGGDGLLSVSYTPLDVYKRQP